MKFYLRQYGLRDTPEKAHYLAWLFQPGMADREITIILYLNEG